MRKMSQRQNSRSEANREKILSAAGRFFWQKGYIATSIDDIAKATKMNKASIYYYFKNKAAILHELGTTTLQAMIDQALPVVNSSLTPEKKMELFITNHIEFLLDHLDLTGIGYKERKHLPRKLFQIYLNLRDEYEGIFRKILQEGVEQGRFSCRDAKLSSLLFMGLLNSTIQWFKPAGKFSPDDVASEVCAIVSKALNVDREPSNQ